MLSGRGREMLAQMQCMFVFSHREWAHDSNEGGIYRSELNLFLTLRASRLEAAITQTMSRQWKGQLAS